MWRRRPQALVSDPPVTVSDLARRLGVRVEELASRAQYAYRWDPYHEAPVQTTEELARRTLTSYRVHLDEPVELPARAGSGFFYLHPQDHGGFVLEWYALEPDWAKPVPDEQARGAALAALAARVRAATGAAEVEDAVAATAGTVGIDPAGRQVGLAPPMPALACARALGFEDALAITVDVHMSAWRLAIAADGSARAPRLGAWRVDAALRGAAGGPPVAGVTVPASAVRHLAEGDLVTGVRFATL